MCEASAQDTGRAAAASALTQKVCLTLVARGKVLETRGARTGSGTALPRGAGIRVIQDKLGLAAMWTYSPSAAPVLHKRMDLSLFRHFTANE